jgi:hypothetical protein
VKWSALDVLIVIKKQSQRLRSWLHLKESPRSWSAQLLVSVRAVLQRSK